MALTISAILVLTSGVTEFFEQELQYNFEYCCRLIDSPKQWASDECIKEIICVHNECLIAKTN